MSRIILLFFTFSCLNTLKAQHREVIIFFNDSTSLEGFGEVRKNKIYFKLEQNDKLSEWDHLSVRAIHFVGYGFIEKYEYVKSDKYNKPKIMELLEEGNVNLYAFSEIVTKSYLPGINFPNNPNAFPAPVYKTGLQVEYFIKRPNEDVATDIVFSFKRRAIRYFSDCPELIEKINNKTFTSANIPEIVTFYNDYCNDELLRD